MEQLVKEIRDDIKTILQNQARDSERIKQHGQEMHNFKKASEAKFDIIHKKVKPLEKAYWGAKWALGALLLAPSIAAAVWKLIG